MNLNEHYYSRITMAFDDLLRARSYANKMLELSCGKSFSSERIIYEALTFSCIIFYGKVFTTSKTVGKEYNQEVSQLFGDLRDKIIKKSLNPKFKALHERLIAERDTAIAHSDAESRNYKYYNESPLPPWKKSILS